MNCKNCHNELPDPSDFCNSCGAKVIRNRLTLKNIFEHVSETFFNYDNKLLRTIGDLFKKPEAVIVSYIDGVRKRYVNPISFFGLALTLSGLYILILKKFYPEAIDFSLFVMEGQEEFQRKNVSFVQEYQSIFMMFYIPIYALMARLTFIGLHKFNYTELIVVFIYTQAQLSIITAFIIVIAAMCGMTHGVISLILFPFLISYTAYCLKRLYHLSLLEIILRTIIFLVILGVFLAIASVIGAIIMFLTGEFDAIIKAQRAATAMIY